MLETRVKPESGIALLQFNMQFIILELNITETNRHYSVGFYFLIHYTLTMDRKKRL